MLSKQKLQNSSEAMYVVLQRYKWEKLALGIIYSM